MLTVAPRAETETDVARCPRSESCPVVRLYGLRGTLGVLQATFCDGRFERCARFRASQAGHAVPANLLPNGRAFAGYVPVR